MKIFHLFSNISCKIVIGFDNVETRRSLKPHGDKALCQELKDIEIHSPTYMSSRPSLQSHRSQVSISMPSTPSGLHINQALKVELNDTAEPSDTCIQQSHPTHFAVNPKQPKKTMFYSQPITAKDGKVANPLENKHKAQMNDNLEDKCCDSFKTWSGKLERQISNLRGKPQVQDRVIGSLQITESEAVPVVGRYFDALEGPELDTLRIHVGVDGRRQMHGRTSDKSLPSKGQSSNTDTIQGKSTNRKSTTLSSINGMTE